MTDDDCPIFPTVQPTPEGILSVINSQATSIGAIGAILIDKGIMTMEEFTRIKAGLDQKIDQEIARQREEYLSRFDCLPEPFRSLFRKQMTGRDDNEP